MASSWAVYSAELVPAAGDALIFSAETIWRHDTGVTAERRHSDARNLAAVLLRLRDGDRRRYQRIVRTVRQVAPSFPADALSDGTLRFICLAALLGQAELPGLAS